MSCAVALSQWLAQYQQRYQQTLHECPRHYSQGEPSLCRQQDYAEPVQWCHVARTEAGSFDNVRQALEIELHQDIEAFYGSHWAGPLHFDAPWGVGELLQVWNEDDFARLQQNLIGHLMMKRKLKQAPSWFIGVTDSDDMICVKNEEGSVWLERPGQEPSTLLAPSIEAFLQQIQPRVAPAVEYVEQEASSVDHPGIFASLKRMWHNLFGRK
ncbi:SecY-interacting protein [Shewanella sp. C32]|uniref:Protein Syd n=1 Tax=Shewanella electrica TaxID=515560 RepID=A0ABT2FKP2_9GAMM|nr:SecY-interacting protein [Shewanella electrica]MCH1924674.1 SecY-interacting protein [Shewanella electrica]MCS4556878.1 SecY-interacting protein [Shewanella electrica]